MARRAAPGTLIHCESCGEDYSATYKRCPFCGEKPGGGTTASLPRMDDPEQDDYVFEGEDLFDDVEDRPSRPARPRGGKRLAQDTGRSSVGSSWPDQLAQAYHVSVFPGHRCRGIGDRVCLHLSQDPQP